MIQDFPLTPAVAEIPVSLDSYFPGVHGQDSSQEIERLRKTHMLYAKYSPLWDFYLAAYEGGTDFANRHNLFRHVRENEKDWDDRVERIHNINYCEVLVDFYTNFIFAEVIERNGGSNGDFYGLFIKDVDRRRTPVDRFMRGVCDDLQIFGMTYGLVDAPALDRASGSVITRYDEQVSGIRPYWVSVKPDEIVDWQTDDLGNYRYVKRKQLKQDLQGVALVDIELYTEFLSDRIIVSKVKVANTGKPELISQVELRNELGRIPIVVKKYKPSKRDREMGLSYLRDFAYNNREILNLTSLLQEFLYRQCFNILAREVDSALPIRDQEDGVIGTSNIMDVPKGAHMPEYVSPPIDPAKFIMEERSRIKNEMFSRASQDAMQELFNGEGRSGFSQAQSFSKTAPFIATRADTLEDFENEMMQLTMERIGKTWDGKVVYKDRYEMTNLTDFLAQFKLLVRDFQIPSEDFVKEQLKRAVRSFDGKLPPESVVTIEKQIDDMDFTDWMETQQIALIGRAAAAPASTELLTGELPTPTMTEVSQEARSTTATTKQPKTTKN